MTTGKLEEGYSKRIDDSLGAIGQITRKNPVAALAITSLGSVITSTLAVMGLMTEPIKSEVGTLRTTVELTREQIYRITEKIGSSPRAMPYVTRLQAQVTGSRRDLTKLQNDIPTIQREVHVLQGMVTSMQSNMERMQDILFEKSTIRANDGKVMPAIRNRHIAKEG